MEHELEEIKAEQGLLAKQYTAVAKSLISSKSHRLSIMIQALKKGEKLSVFESIYRSQTTAHEKRLRRASKQRDYEKYSVHKVAIGEVDNVWLQFYENKQKLRERMIHDINERICDIQREFYMKAERDNRASDPKTLVQNMRRVAANLGPTPALSGLQPDEIEADLARLRSRHSNGSTSEGSVRPVPKSTTMTYKLRHPIIIINISTRTCRTNNPNIYKLNISRTIIISISPKNNNNNKKTLISISNKNISSSSKYNHHHHHRHNNNSTSNNSRSRHFHHLFLINSNHSSTNCNSINSTCSSSNNTNCNSNNINTNYINNINWSSNNIINTNWSSSRDLLFPRCLKP
ncbi:hypothetical protein DV452_001034 [Geotrichum candidum]|nr:hypothetical protein DV454_003318 [Geotrichum candidum]KAF5120811.1 hypothetical protein DV452_001034 [Geotrichum candidum]KAI9213825.1 hypothetical protein DS838_001254 [Geotrichum bryndzae]